MISQDRLSSKERLVLFSGLALCMIVLSSSYILSTSHRKIYTVEVYQVFDITHKLRLRDNQTFTCVYTYGKGQFYFRGDYNWSIDKSYVFTYRETGKRWRDLELLEVREFDSIVDMKFREEKEDCGSCP
jgi:hypothetical protein